MANVEIPTDLALLVGSLLRDPVGGNEAVGRHTPALTALVDRLQDGAEEELPLDVLQLLLRYRSQHGHLPPNTASASDYLNNSAHDMSVLLTTDHLESLSVEQADALDPEPVIARILDNAKRLRTIRTLEHCRLLLLPQKIENAEIMQRLEIALGKGAAQQPDKVDLAKRYFAARTGLDPFGTLPEEGYGLAENAKDVMTDLLSYLDQGQQQNRIFLGLPQIDRCIQIGRGFRHNLIGIMGYSNHGKSTLLQTIALNIAMTGKSVLYLGLEQHPLKDSTAQFMAAFAALLRMRGKVTSDIGGVEKWREGKPPAGGEATLRRITTLASESGMRLYAERVWAWDNLVNLLDSTDAKRNYDALIIDYPERMQLSAAGTSGTRYRDSTEESKEIFRRIDRLCRNFGGGRGLTIFEAMQVNREGAEEVAKQDGEKRGYYHNMSALKQFSGAAQDMDLLIGAWRDTENETTNSEGLDEANRLQLACVKQRGKPFPDHEVTIDPASRLVHDPSDQGSSSSRSFAYKATVNPKAQAYVDYYNARQAAENI